jgi:hypothetical protein
VDSVVGVIATVAKKVIVNARENPVVVNFSWKAFQEIAETLGWDLDKEAKKDLRQTRRDLARRNRKAFIALFPMAQASGEATLNVSPELLS